MTDPFTETSLVTQDSDGEKDALSLDSSLSSSCLPSSKSPHNRDKESETATLPNQPAHLIDQNDESSQDFSTELESIPDTTTTTATAVAGASLAVSSSQESHSLTSQDGASETVIKEQKSLSSLLLTVLRPTEEEENSCVKALVGSKMHARDIQDTMDRVRETQDSQTDERLLDGKVFEGTLGCACYTCDDGGDKDATTTATTKSTSLDVGEGCVRLVPSLPVLTLLQNVNMVSASQLQSTTSSSNATCQFHPPDATCAIDLLAFAISVANDSKKSDDVTELQRRLDFLKGNNGSSPQMVLSHLVYALVSLDKNLDLGSHQSLVRFARLMLDDFRPQNGGDSHSGNPTSNNPTKFSPMKEQIQKLKESELIVLCQILWHRLLSIHLFLFDGEVRSIRLWLKLGNLVMETTGTDNTDAALSTPTALQQYCVKTRTTTPTEDQKTQEFHARKLDIIVHCPSEVTPRGIAAFQKEAYQKSEKYLQASDLAWGASNVSVLFASMVSFEKTIKSRVLPGLSCQRAMVSRCIEEFVNNCPVSCKASELIVAATRTRWEQAKNGFNQYRTNKEAPTNMCFFNCMVDILSLVLHYQKDVAWVTEFFKDRKRCSLLLPVSVPGDRVWTSSLWDHFFCPVINFADSIEDKVPTNVDALKKKKAVRAGIAKAYLRFLHNASAIPGGSTETFLEGLPKKVAIIIDKLDKRELIPHLNNDLDHPALHFVAQSGTSHSTPPKSLQELLQLSGDEICLLGKALEEPGGRAPSTHESNGSGSDSQKTSSERPSSDELSTVRQGCRQSSKKDQNTEGSNKTTSPASLSSRSQAEASSNARLDAARTLTDMKGDQERIQNGMRKFLQQRPKGDIQRLERVVKILFPGASGDTVA